MSNQLHDIPGNHVATAPIRAHAAATATELVGIFRAPFACKIISVEILWDAAITGADTNTTHVNLHNRGTAGTGTTELGNIDYVSGTDAAAFVAEDLYSPATPLEVAEGVILAIQLEKVASGLALPNGTAIVTYQGN
jgi:hypothetical protein